MVTGDTPTHRDAVGVALTLIMLAITVVMFAGMVLRTVYLHGVLPR